MDTVQVLHKKQLVTAFQIQQALQRDRPGTSRYQTSRSALWDPEVSLSTIATCARPVVCMAEQPSLPDLICHASLSNTQSRWWCWHALADRFASDGDKDGADAALYAADRAHKHCQTEDAMLDAMEAAEAKYDAQKQPGAAMPHPLQANGHGAFLFACRHGRCLCITCQDLLRISGLCSDWRTGQEVSWRRQYALNSLLHQKEVRCECSSCIGCYPQVRNLLEMSRS